MAKGKNGKVAARGKKKGRRKPAAGRIARLREYRDVGARPQSRRLVKLFSDAEQLAHDIWDYQCDHPPKCRCKTCEWVNESCTGPPNTRHYLTAIHAIIRSATAIYEELPGYPERPGAAAEPAEAKS